MKKITTISIAALFCAATAAQAADLYFDLNGTDPGFNVTSTNDPHEVNFTNATWNTDSTGGAGGILTTVSDGDILHFGLEHTGGNLFNWTYFTNKTVGGIHTYQTAGSTASINRFQKPGGGLQTINWASGATFDTEKACSFWWDLGMFGDFEKIGNQWLILTENSVRVNGTCTISQGNVIYRDLDAAGSVSSFNLNGGELRFMHTLDDGGPVTADLGTLSGSGQVTKDGGTGAQPLSNLTLNLNGANMTNGVATDLIKLSWGIAATLQPGASTIMEITKNGGTNYADNLEVNWTGRTLALDGDLDVILLGGSEALVAGDSFDLLSDNLSGSFDNVNLPDIGDPGLIWSTAGLTASGVIEVVVADASPPSAPTGLSAVSNIYTVSLDWNDNPEPTVTGYNVYRSDTSGSGFVLIGSNTVSEYHDTTTIPDDNTYFYKVAAYNFADVEGTESSEESTTVLFNLRNGDFELPVLATDSSTSIDASGDWAQDGSNQKIHSHAWAPESGAQGVRLEGWKINTTNSFWQDKEGSEGIEYTLDSGFKLADNFIPNGSQVDMSLVWLNAGAVEISRNSLDVDAALAGTNDWVHLAITNTAPAGTATVRALIEWRTDSSNEFSGSASAFVDNVTLTRDSAPSAYEAWASSYGLTNGPTADDDGDMLDNLSEYALGGNPTNAADVGTTPVSMTLEDGGTNAFDYVYVRKTDVNSGITYKLVLTENLVIGPWSTNTGFTVTGIGPDVGGFEEVTNRTSTTEDRKFINLVIEQN